MSKRFLHTSKHEYIAKERVFSLPLLFYFHSHFLNSISELNHKMKSKILVFKIFSSEIVGMISNSSDKQSFNSLSI